MTARADVYELEPSGQLVVHSGPSVYLTPDLRGIPITNAGSYKPQPVDRRIAQSIEASALRHNLSPALIAAMAWRESRMNNAATSPKGAVGVMQLMPETAHAYAIDPHDPVANIEAGAAYIAALTHRYHNDLADALAAYNAGPAAVDRSGGLPPFRETRDYVNAIFDRMAAAALAPDSDVAIGQSR